MCQGSILALHVPSTMETFAPSSASRAFSSLRRSPRTSGSRCVRPCPPRRWRSWRERTMKRPPAWPRRRAPAPTAPSRKKMAKMEEMERLRVQQVVVPTPSSWSKLWWKRLIIWRLRWRNCKSEVAPVHVVPEKNLCFSFPFQRQSGCEIHESSRLHEDLSLWRSPLGTFWRSAHMNQNEEKLMQLWLRGIHWSFAKDQASLDFTWYHLTLYLCFRFVFFQWSSFVADRFCRPSKNATGRPSWLHQSQGQAQQ